jgi:hypothetical protein
MVGKVRFRTYTQSHWRVSSTTEKQRAEKLLL